MNGKKSVWKWCPSIVAWANIKEKDNRTKKKSILIDKIADNNDFNLLLREWIEKENYDET